jgi:tetratricopeptide (TPR) repeat protein
MVLSPPTADAQAPAWEKHMDAGRAAFKQKNFEKAGRSFEAALKAAQDFPSQDTRRGLTLNHLATVYSALEDYERAEALLKRARGIWQQAPPPGQLELAKTLHSLASVYYAQGRYAEAEPLLRRALALREQSLPADHPAVKRTHKSLATLEAAMNPDAAGGAKTAEKTPAPTPAPAPAPAPAKEQQAAKKTKAKTEPVATQTAIKTAGAYAAHLASLRTVASAKNAWAELQKAHPGLLDGLELAVVAADLGERGVYQRVLAQSFESRAAVQAFCAKVKARAQQQYCVAVKR